MAGDEAGEGMGLALKELACHAGSRGVERFYFGVTGSWKKCLVGVGMARFH